MCDLAPRARIIRHSFSVPGTDSGRLNAREGPKTKQLRDRRLLPDLPRQPAYFPTTGSARIPTTYSVVPLQPRDGYGACPPFFSPALHVGKSFHPFCHLEAHVRYE